MLLTTEGAQEKKRCRGLWLLALVSVLVPLVLFVLAPVCDWHGRIGEVPLGAGIQAGAGAPQGVSSSLAYDLLGGSYRIWVLRVGDWWWRVNLGWQPAPRRGAVSFSPR